MLRAADIRRACLALLAVAPLADTGAELEWAVRAGAGYSDNVNRVDTGEVGSAVAIAGLLFNGRRPNGRLRFDLNGNVDYYEYLRSGVEGELVGTANASASYDLVPETLDWSVQGSFDQQRENLLLPASPGNREDVISLSTGPSLRIRIGSGLRATADARYTTAMYSGRSLDNDTASIGVGLQRLLGEAAFVGLGASFSDVSYGTGGAFVVPDYERQEIFLTSSLRGSRTDLQVDVGYSTIDNGSVETSDPLLRAQLTRRLTPSLAAYVRLTQEHPTTEANLDSFPPAGEAGDRAVLSTSPRRSQVGVLGLTFTRPRTSMDLSAEVTREKGELSSAGTRSTTAFRARLNRNLTPRSSVSVNAGYLKDDFSTALADADETFAGASYSLAFGSKLHFDAQVQIRNRDAQFAGGNYDELTAGLYLRYGKIASRALVEPTAR